MCKIIHNSTYPTQKENKCFDTSKKCKANKTYAVYINIYE